MGIDEFYRNIHCRKLLYGEFANIESRSVIKEREVIAILYNLGNANRLGEIYKINGHAFFTAVAIERFNHECRFVCL